ncbi:metal dependent phosphohydrolase [Desulforamulus reducens MI-1]|uniref:Metal dependent phosphohydrolase n=1 Tax=Desulforamulus reducens (strain ATCC BAA-1160 / DSM 100696 / MI-1) TaxID=349161 RepID=A4J0V4_DESRM|nr:HD domain-containing protein [Desulforamulus reducens]ABO48707.1 metal dependent phosphohydrolase [Desulforamulus reducens MI-1]
MSTISMLSQQLSIQTYLVGGAVRDLFLNKIPVDLDFCVTAKVFALAQTLTQQYQGSLVTLDDQREMLRVVTNSWHLDFSPLRDEILEKDLFARDFTLNAMALPVSMGINKYNWQNQIQDPTGGKGDLKKGLLRAASSSSIQQDPLRSLRGIRFAATYNLAIIPETMVLLRQGTRRIEQIAGERLWHELAILFKLPITSFWINYMDQELHFWQYLLPGQLRMAQTKQNHYHVENVWRHCLRTYECLEVILQELSTIPSEGEPLLIHFNQHLSGGRSRCQVLKLAALIHDVGKPDTAVIREDGRISFHGHAEAGVPYAEALATRLKLSRLERHYLVNLVLLHMLPLNLYNSGDRSDLSVYRLFRSLENYILDVLILSLADVTATLTAGERISELEAYRTFILNLLGKFIVEKDRFHPVPYLSGAALLELGIPEGPEVGLILEKLCEEQVTGSITDTKTALLWVKTKLAGNNKDK